MTKLLLLIVLLLVPSLVCAQDRTEAFQLPHPETGEPGVWVPTWLQQEFLLTESTLQSCEKERTTYRLELKERQLELKEVYSATLNLQSALEQQKRYSAAQRVRADDAEDTSQGRLLWATTSTGAAAVAILLLVLEAL
jgi:hypothetical protein